MSLARPQVHGSFLVSSPDPETTWKERNKSCRGGGLKLESYSSSHASTLKSVDTMTVTERMSRTKRYLDISYAHYMPGCGADWYRFTQKIRDSSGASMMTDQEMATKLEQIRIQVDILEDQIILSLNKIAEALDEGNLTEARDFIKSLLKEVQDLDA